MKRRRKDLTTTTFKVAPDLHAALDLAAKERGMTRSELIRLAISMALDVCPACGRANKRKQAA